MIALVLGAADCLPEDVEAATALVDYRECLVVACNDAGILWPHRLDHWATLHPNELWWRERQRRERGYPDGYVTWTKVWPPELKENEAICDRTLDGWQGSSGLLALGAALQHAEAGILCGIPMDPRPHIRRRKRWGAAHNYRDRWEALHDTLAPRVRSMSGWTMERFGEPTPDWLAAHMPGWCGSWATPVVLTQHIPST